MGVSWAAADRGDSGVGSGCWTTRDGLDSLLTV